MISQHVRQRAAFHAGEFSRAKPFRHVVIDDFLEPAACQALLDQFPSFEDRYAFNEMGRIGNKAVRTDVGGLADAYRALDAQVRSTEFLSLVSTITGIPGLLYDPDYIGGGTHENRNGQGLDPHIDFNILPGRQWHRRLNLIVYLNPEWEEAWGGCIELHSDPWSAENQRVGILPLSNRCVIFETNEHSWHGFETIRLPPERAGLSRKSFAIYLYTADRPDRERAPSHGTVYVPAGMPPWLQPGATLMPHDHAELQRRFGHLLEQLRFLYGRELEFSAQIERQQQALAEAASRTRIDLQGYALQEQGAEGIWPDGWWAVEARMRFKPTRRADRLTLGFLAPAGLVGPQELRLALGGCEQSLILAPGETGEVVLRLPLPEGSLQELRLSARHSWSPREGGDRRELACLLLRAVLHHPPDVFPTIMA